MPEYRKVVGPHWTGFDNVRFLFVFGDSYSAVGAPREPVPSKDVPLGIDFPGLTYNEPDEPNWVGCLVANYHSMLVYDYAVGGHTIDGVRAQIQNRFLPSAGKKPDWAPWNASSSLFVTWIGINDCAFRSSWSQGEFEKYLKSLFEQQEDLYQAGARNFLFLDVPPIDKAPASRRYTRLKQQSESTPFTRWNAALNKRVEEFSALHHDITALVFSAYDTFTNVLSDPAAYGFDESEAHEAGGPIWFDHLHPTSAMHAIVAREVAEFLVALPPSNGEPFPSTAVQVGSQWAGFAKLKYLVIFGASYCDIGYDRSAPHPTMEQPLGVSFPGYTWAEPGTANWVGHLVTRLKDQRTGVLVYDFGRGGDTVDGVERQIREQFLPELALHPAWAPWTAGDSLFMIWVGINDCAFSDIKGVPARVTKLFNHIDTLYDAGARNFLLVNLPPIDRSPTGRKSSTRHTFEGWNDALKVFSSKLADRHPEATILIYSSHTTFTRVLDDPVAHGFRAEDVDKAGGSIWYDNLHPSSQMHDEIAKDLVEFLSTVPQPS